MTYLKKALSALLFITAFTATLTVINTVQINRLENKVEAFEPVVVVEYVQETEESEEPEAVSEETTEESEEISEEITSLVEEETSVVEIQPPRIETLGEYRITAYCACEKCCGKWALNRPNGIVYGAAGVELEAGVSCASPLPFGTVVEVEGLGEYIVQDRLAQWVVDKYGENLIDIYFDDHEAAKEFGLQYHNVYLKGWVENAQM